MHSHTTLLSTSVYFIPVLLIHIYQVDLLYKLFENKYSDVHIICWSVISKLYQEWTSLKVLHSKRMFHVYVVKLPF